MASRTIVAGIDSSTQSCKIVRVDAETGQVLGSSSAPHPDSTAVHPDRWWEAFQAAGGAELDDVEALSVSAQQHGMVALDADDAPVFDALLWNDVRSAPQAQRLRDEVDDYVDTTLANFEQFLTKALAAIERGRDKMHALREIGSFTPDDGDRPLPF